MRGQGLRPGDPECEQWGICDHIAKPRVQAAITGKTPDGEVIRGDYKFSDEFPIAEGFEENAEFFTLTYETPIAVSHPRSGSSTTHRPSMPHQRTRLHPVPHLSL